MSEHYPQGTMEMMVRSELALGVGSVILLNLVAVAIALGTISTTAGERDRAADRALAEIAAADRLQFEAERVVATIRGLLLTADDEYLHRQEQALTSFQSALAAVEHGASGPNAERLRDVAQTAWAYFSAAEAAVQKRESADVRSIVPFFEKVVEPKREAFGDAVKRLVESERALVAHAIGESRNKTRASAAVAIGASCAGVLLSIGLGVLVARRLGRLFARERAAVTAANLAVRSRDEVLSVVSHDLRNPLGTIVLSAKSMQSSAELDSRYARHVSRIESAAERMRRLIDDLLDSARLETGALTLHCEPCDAAELLAETARLFETQAAGRSIRISSHSDAEGAAWLDRERILQVLSNLVGNALRFTPDGGIIVLDVSNDEHVLRFSVRDSGPGIPEADVPHLFDRGWQGEQGAHTGLGLGLYIARSIIELHGGRIAAESRPGEGARFMFELPRRSQDPQFV